MCAQLTLPQRSDILHKLQWQFPPSSARFPFEEQTKKLCELLPIYEMTVFEPGCGEGYSTCYLANQGAKVSATDGRPMQVIKAFARTLYEGARDVKLWCETADDMHKIPTDKYDLCFHQGLYYHLPAPVKHFKEIAGKFKFIYLNTHVADLSHTVSDRLSVEEIPHDGYSGKAFQEGGWEDELSGLNPLSFWLTKRSLQQLIEDCRYRILAVVADLPDARNGYRVCWLLERR